MYIRPDYRIDDERRLWEVVRDHSFATLVSAADGEPPLATLVPHLVVPDPDGRHRLWAHMARANPQWTTFGPGREVLSIFRGPDAYISPSWYVNGPYVPTWNFVVVHVYGVPRLLGPDDQDEKRWVLEQTVEQHERHRRDRWRLDVPEPFLASLMKEVTAFDRGASDRGAVQAEPGQARGRPPGGGGRPGGDGRPRRARDRPLDAGPRA